MPLKEWDLLKLLESVPGSLRLVLFVCCYLKYVFDV